MNLVTLIGRLTADPDLRFINTGTAISKFTIAIDRSYRKDNQAVTDFIPVEIWGKKAEYCATYIEKGCLVAVSGSLHIDRYTDSEGNNRSFAKVVANSIMKLNSPNKSANIENNDTSGNGDGNEVANDGSSGGEIVSPNNDPIANLTECADDDLPF
ncbi:single-stranded DNA-binding protein [Intestinibacter sp.]